MSSSTSSSRRRVASLGFSFAALLTAAVALLALLSWDTLVAAGERELKHRPVDLVRPERLRPDVPLAVFLGDSTFLPGYAYPRLLSRQLGDAAEVRTFWWEGFEPFHHYLLAGRAMELGPDAVVVVAQMRVFWRHEPLWYPDLLTLVPPRELSRAVLLPFHERGISVPRLVLASLLGSLRETGEAWLRAFVGARLRAGQVAGLRWLVPESTPVGGAARLIQLREERFRRYTLPIYPGHPAVRALAATVEQATRGGARTLVLVSPIPIARLREAGLYDAAVFDTRVQVIRDAVEAEGGELLDLHAVFTEADFSDEFGHMTESGARKVALVLEPWLRDALELRGRRQRPR